jgi:SAM-dependent methyltransferase
MTEEDPSAAFMLASEVLGEQLLAALPPDLDLAGGRVLDFGCGPGRLLAYLLDHPARPVLEGFDIDERCVEWLAPKLSPPHGAFRCAEETPLPRPDAHYRLVCCVSVFSHLTGSWADWLCELHRLLEPHGVMAASVIGRHLAREFGEDPWEEERVGMLVLGRGRPWSAGGPMVVHSEWWLREHWGRAFEILDVRRFGAEPPQPAQTLLTMRKREVRVSPEQLRAIKVGDWREVPALEHALERTQQESAELNVAHDSYAAAYRSESERAERLRGEVRALRAQLSDLREPRASAHGWRASVRRAEAAVRARLRT